MLPKFPRYLFGYMEFLLYNSGIIHILLSLYCENTVEPTWKSPEAESSPKSRIMSKFPLQMKQQQGT